MNNCLIYALALYFRRRSRGKSCQIVMRKARGGFYPHFMFAEQRAGRRRLVHYQPYDVSRDSGRGLMFCGWVKWGEGEREINEALAPAVRSLFEWAATADTKDIYCISTKFGTLAFFESQVGHRPRHVIEQVLMDRIDEARRDRS